MLTYTDLPLIPTQVLGSHGLPSWMWVVRDAVAAGTMGPADIDEALKDAVNLAIMDMEEAGVDIISDGEMQRADFTWNFHERVLGLEPIEFPRRLGYPGPDQLDAFRCVAPLSIPKGYGTAAEYEYARTRTSKPLLSPLQSPVTQAFRIHPGDVYRDKGEIAWALVPFINKELKEVVAAGCRHVQFDEPAYWIVPGGVEEMVEIFNACVEGVEATIGFHLCFGNFRGRPATSVRSFAALAPHFKDLEADVIHIEFANRNMYEIELWEKFGGDKILCAGVIDVKGRSLEPVEVVTGRIRTALEYCAPEKLWVAPDCGFSQTVRWLAVEKMKVMVEAAALVREELG
ncbi:MAG: cobalamin-independent methionine synthase II family protein [Anaerolineae bacterium]|nr:cobalamin-independent methionine synthase II family protein [Anaerolineae bacterium]